MLKLFFTCAISTVLIIAGGCAPERLTEGVTYSAERGHVRDAGALCVAGKGHLRFDAALRSDLEDAIAATDLPTMTQRGADVLRRSNALAIKSVDSELDRMPAEELNSLIRTYGLASSSEDRSEEIDCVKSAYSDRAQSALENDLAEIDSASGLRAERRILSRILGRIEPSPGDRGKLGRVLLAAPLFVPASIGAEIADHEATQRAMVADFTHVIEYRPAETDDVGAATTLERADAAVLARWFAPVFEQQVDPNAEYPVSEDKIGRVYLTGAPNDIRVNIDIGDPVVYWTRQQAKVGERKYDQLIYVAWYPSRPALTPNDPAAGRIDGLVMRITLDRHERPAVYEFVRSCGCYHTLWVAEFVESAARQQFGPPPDGEEYAVQRETSGRDLFMPELVRDDGARPRRPIAYVGAGHHLLTAVKPLVDERDVSPAEARMTYRLEPYEALTRLPLGKGVASMFGSDGLVHDAGRGEGWLLAPTGMLSAGQPRQLGTMKIRMDAYDYDDPRLLERNLRLPDGF